MWDKKILFFLYGDECIFVVLVKWFFKLVIGLFLFMIFLEVVCILFIILYIMMMLLVGEISRFIDLFGIFV